MPTGTRGGPGRSGPASRPAWTTSPAAPCSSAGHDAGRPAPGQLAAALYAELPPEEIPPAATARQRQPAPADGRPAGPLGGRDRATGPVHGLAGAPPAARPRGHAPAPMAIVALVLVVVAGAASRDHGCWHKSGSATPAAIVGSARRAAAARDRAEASVGARLRRAQPGRQRRRERQPGPERDRTATRRGWSSQQYFSPAFGNLKAGTGLILDMGRTVKLSSITVQFGSAAGADVQIKLGNSATRSAANEASMATVASANRRRRPATPSPVTARQPGSTS